MKLFSSLDYLATEQKIAAKRVWRVEECAAPPRAAVALVARPGLGSAQRRRPARPGAAARLELTLCIALRTLAAEGGGSESLTAARSL